MLENFAKIGSIFLKILRCSESNNMDFTSFLKVNIIYFRFRNLSLPIYVVLDSLIKWTKRTFFKLLSIQLYEGSFHLDIKNKKPTELN